MLKKFLVSGILLAGIFSVFAGKEKEIKAVSLSPAVTEIIYALGAEESLVGRSSACNYPLAVKKLPVMGDFGNPNRERIVKSGAKLVLTNDLINPSLVKRYKSMGISLHILPLTHEKEYLFLLSFLGKLFRKEKEAAALEASFRKELALLEENRKLLSLHPRRKALFIVWDRPLLAAGGKSLPGRILVLAGLKNIASHIKSDYFKASMEWIMREDPDCILFPGIPENRARLLQNAPYWKEMKAVRQGNLITDLDEDLLFRLGPRWGRGVVELQKKIFFREKLFPKVFQP